MRDSDPLDQQIEAFAQYLRDERRSSPRTVETYIRDLRSFRDYIREEGLSADARKIDIVALRGFLAPEYNIQCIEAAVELIKEELGQRLERLKGSGKLLEAQRLSARTRFDLEMLQEVGYDLTGWEGVLSSDVPVGSGLSSSAALEMATARALAAAIDAEPGLLDSNSNRRVEPSVDTNGHLTLTVLDPDVHSLKIDDVSDLNLLGFTHGDWYRSTTWSARAKRLAGDVSLT